MGEVLGIGFSHYPGIRGTDDAMAGILRGTLQRPDIPPEAKDPATWPESMQIEWADDEGRGAAPEHRRKFVVHMRVIREELDAFKPDFVVVWGDDQYENFHEDIIPSFCIYAYDDVTVQPHLLRAGTLVEASEQRVAPNIWNEGADKTYVIRGKREAAKYLARELLQQDIDVAYSYKPLHYKGFSHAFLNAVLYLDYDRKGFDYPVIAFAVNCYGSRVLVNKGGRFPIGKITVPEGDLDPPGPSPQRCMAIGAATARALVQSPWRVAVIASSSWSHAFLTPKHHFLYPDVDSDRRLFEALKAGDYDFWRSKTLADVEDAGQQEVLNWWCLMGAMEELGRKPDYTGYIESYVMNSNKAFAVYRP